MKSKGLHKTDGRMPKFVDRVQQRQQGYLLALLMQLLGHLKGDRAAEAKASQVIGALRLERAHLFEIMHSHLFNTCVEGALPVQSLPLKGIERLI